MVLPPGGTVLDALDAYLEARWDGAVGQAAEVPEQRAGEGALAVGGDIADETARNAPFDEVEGVFDGKDEQTVDRLAKAAPLERLGQPEDIAETVAFLAGPARWINGQTLFANGGLA